MLTSRIALSAVLAALLVAFPASVAAQSGTPGSGEASDGVYGGGDILGDEPRSEPETPRDNPTDDGDPGDPDSGIIAGPGDPGDGEAQSVPFAASDSGDSGGDDTSSLPFTGFYAVLALGVALGLIVVGFTIRRFGDRAVRGG